jgi:hypothetical protein
MGMTHYTTSEAAHTLASTTRCRTGFKLQPDKTSSNTPAGGKGKRPCIWTRGSPTRGSLIISRLQLPKEPSARQNVGCVQKQKGSSPKWAQPGALFMKADACSIPQPRSHRPAASAPSACGGCHQTGPCPPTWPLLGAAAGRIAALPCDTANAWHAAQEEQRSSTGSGGSCCVYVRAVWTVCLNRRGAGVLGAG